MALPILCVQKLDLVPWIADRLGEGGPYILLYVRLEKMSLQKYHT